jgi:hypothetical protein
MVTDLPLDGFNPLDMLARRPTLRGVLAIVRNPSSGRQLSNVFFLLPRQYEREQFIVPILTEGALKEFILSLDRVLLFIGNLVEQQIQNTHPPK